MAAIMKGNYVIVQWFKLSLCPNMSTRVHRPLAGLRWQSRAWLSRV